MSRHNSLVAVATHDLDITNMLGDLYECYYFTENVEKYGLEFDYQIRKRVSSTRNAIKVLQFMGYPKEITNRTNERISKCQDELKYNYGCHLPRGWHQQRRKL